MMERRHITPAIWTENEKDIRKAAGQDSFRNSEEAVEGELRKSSSSDFWKSQKTGDWNLEK